MNYQRIFDQIKKLLFTKKIQAFFGTTLHVYNCSKMLENSIPLKQMFFNTSLKVSQKNKCISIVVLLVFNFKKASRLFEHPIQRNFRQETYASHTYCCRTQIGKFVGVNEKLARCEKRCEINIFSRGLFPRVALILNF